MHIQLSGTDGAQRSVLFVYVSAALAEAIHVTLIVASK